MERNRFLPIGIVSAAVCLFAPAVFAVTRYERLITSNPHLVGYWQFEQAEGAAYAVDTTPGLPADNAIYAGPNDGPGAKHDVAGIVGHGVFIGSSSGTYTRRVYASGLPALNAMNNPANWTVEFWINPTGPSPYVGMPSVSGKAYFDGYTTLAGEQDSFHMLFQSGGIWLGLGGAGQYSQIAPRSQPHGIVIGQWNLVALTFAEDPAGNTSGWLRYYVNGVDLRDYHLSDLPDITVPGSRGVWDGFSLGDGQFAGALDEFAIFNSALFSQDLLDQFDAATDTAVPEPGPLMLLAFGGALLAWRRRLSRA